MPDDPWSETVFVLAWAHVLRPSPAKPSEFVTGQEAEALLRVPQTHFQGEFLGPIPASTPAHAIQTPSETLRRDEGLERQAKCLSSVSTWTAVQVREREGERKTGFGASSMFHSIGPLAAARATPTVSRVGCQSKGHRPHTGAARLRSRNGPLT